MPLCHLSDFVRSHKPLAGLCHHSPVTISNKLLTARFFVNEDSVGVYPPDLYIRFFKYIKDLGQMVGTDSLMYACLMKAKPLLFYIFSTKFIPYLNILQLLIKNMLNTIVLKNMIKVLKTLF